MRTISTEAETQLERGEGAVRFAVKFTFPSGTYRFWDEDEGTLTIDGETYVGAGAIAEFSGVPGGGGLAADRFAFTLDGTRMVQADVAGDPAALLATFHDEDYRNRPVDLTMVLFESAPGDLVLALPLLSGVVTGAPLRVGEEARLDIECQTRSALLGRQNGGTRSKAHQRGLYAEDTGLDYVVDTVNGEASLWWGPSPTRRTTSGGGGGGFNRNPLINLY